MALSPACAGEPAAEEVRAVAKAAAKPTRQAHEFTYPDINPASPTFGEKLALADLRAEQGVVLNFLASWCPPCWHEVPDLIQVADKVATPVVCVAADEYGPPDDLLRLAEQAGLKLPIVLVPKDEIEQMESHYDHGMLPTTYWIGSDGNILERHQGQLSENDLYQVTRKNFPAKP